MSKKVLIITYYWPPAGGPGVQRWLKFVKYLPEFGIEPIVFTPENPSYPIIDETLQSEVSKDLKVIKTKIWEPYQLAEFLNPKSKQYKAGHFEKSDKQSFLTQLSVFIRGNFFIPDARKFWIKPSVQYLKKYLNDNQIDTIITSGPPHSLHLIGLELKKENQQLNWLADFRDPWTQISYHSELKLSQKAKSKHLKLEQSVMQSADVILATSFTDADNYQKISAKRVEVLTNGFEEDDFDKNSKILENQKFTLTYSGGLEIARNPLVVWKALNELIHENNQFSKDLELRFYGNLSQEVENFLKENSLDYCLINFGYVSHKESISGIVNSNLLLLSNFPDQKSKGILPGKIFEYMATENPILAIGPEGGDVAKILENYSNSTYCTHLEKEKVKDFIFKIYKDWQAQIKHLPNSDYKQFSRKSLTEKLVKIIQS